MIEDEKGLVSLDIFKKMFFTFFKGERYAYQIYEMLQPAVSVHWDERKDCQIDSNSDQANESNKFIQIQLLTKFIDLFNFYPVQVGKLRQKNDSNEVTFVMTSGVHGSINERGETLQPKQEAKTDEEKHLIKLLALVSDKIKERFVNIQQCFRFLDTDHSQSISINEFAQAIEHMRLKLSFEDIKKLFTYMDKSGNGDIGYDEFTLLLEERWRGIDPIDLKKANMKDSMRQTIDSGFRLGKYIEC